ncbi:carbohydrate-binding protein [Streptomyces fodineus]|uniref:Carbohydrate-binding protein n=1 Tax=Streptomyces fodineus TaxID=1904616 RepID=A0A1D7YDH8_9ACTN|nr:CBM35 domain-containing protein [Streptomyces fodineus]AOR33611.1 carbohydrate-binding protein [Streptomyces fodineus]
MTPGENGPSTPEDDDPFGYLYADGQARGAQPPSGGYGYPNSVSRVRTVGERQYGQPQPQYGVPQQQGAYGHQPNAHYQAPETLPGGAPTTRQSPLPAPARRGPNTKGLLIGAIAVVAAVVIGIGVSMLTGNDDKKTGNQAGNTPSQSQSHAPSPSASNSAASGSMQSDASALQPAGGAAKASDVKGANSSDGSYVTGLNTPGASVTWTVNAPSDGPYTLFVYYSATGGDQSMTVAVNGTPFGSKLGMKNWRQAKDGDFANGWTRSYVWPDLKQGANTISISCGAGDQCNALISKVKLKPGHVTNDS